MPNDFSPPERGLILWSVGTGDSTTVIVDDDHWVQIDLHQLTVSEDDEDDRVPVVDRLLELAPTKNGKPYVAAFAATHLDKDHILGFAKLSEEALIGELWFTPRVYRDADSLREMCDDAKAFIEEVERRESVVINGAADSGDRIRIIGDDDLLGESPYSEMPAACFALQGEFFTELDGDDLVDIFRVFILAPKKGDGSEERNDTSLGLQILLVDGEKRGTFITLGDLAYPDVNDIFERESDDDLLWNVLQAPHHCSKKVMYWQGEDDTAEVRRNDVLERITETADERNAWIVASCEPVPAQDKAGANPPHRLAATAYEECVESGNLIVTGDHAPTPLVFELTDGGLCLREDDLSESANPQANSLTVPQATAAASGRSTTSHTSATGFGADERRAAWS